jgi:hypothetical protein
LAFNPYIEVTEFYLSHFSLPYRISVVNKMASPFSEIVFPLSKIALPLSRIAFFHIVLPLLLSCDFSTIFLYSPRIRGLIRNPRITNSQCHCLICFVPFVPGVEAKRLGGLKDFEDLKGEPNQEDSANKSGSANLKEKEEPDKSGSANLEEKEEPDKSGSEYFLSLF